MKAGKFPRKRPNFECTFDDGLGRHELPALKFEFPRFLVTSSVPPSVSQSPSRTIVITLCVLEGRYHFTEDGIRQPGLVTSLSAASRELNEDLNAIEDILIRLGVAVIFENLKSRAVVLGLDFIPTETVASNPHQSYCICTTCPDFLIALDLTLLLITDC